MKNKSAMQQLIEKLEEKRDWFKADGNISDRQSRGIYVDCIIKATELLEAEKRQKQESNQQAVRLALQTAADKMDLLMNKEAITGLEQEILEKLNKE